ncbi:UNVERIFIED_CONTAM: hypothetical protein OHV15_14545 [Microbacterium sp. SLM126]
MLPVGDLGREIGAVVSRRVGAGGERAGERAQPGADRREAEELEACERDESRGEEHHPRREQHDAERRHRAEALGEPGDPEARRDDREKRKAQTGRRDVVHDGAHRDGDQTHDGQMQTRGYDGHAEGARRTASGCRGEYGDGENTVGGEQESGYDRRAVEDVSGKIVEAAEPGEVQLPPQWIARREDRYDHSGGKRGHCSVAEVMGMVMGPMSRRGRAGDRGDAQAFGRGEEGQRAHVLQVRRAPKSPTPLVDYLGDRRALCGRDPQISGIAAASMITPQ